LLVVMVLHTPAALRWLACLVPDETHSCPRLLLLLLLL
jgi:hypothetical protein